MIRFSAFLLGASLFLVGFGPALAAEKPVPTVTLHCSNADLVGVLKQIAKRMGRNIVVGPGVTGKVTADFKEVPAERALGLCLSMQTAKYRYKIVGNTIIVATPEKMRTMPDNL